jgi:nitrate reductase gamma subunit
VALRTAGNTLTWGGVAFVAGGAFGLVFPGAAGLTVASGLHVHNLDHLGIALVLVMVSVIGVGITTLVRQTRAETRAASSRLLLRDVAG